MSKEKNYKRPKRSVKINGKYYSLNTLKKQKEIKKNRMSQRPTVTLRKQSNQSIQ